MILVFRRKKIAVTDSQIGLRTFGLIVFWVGDCGLEAKVLGFF